MRKTVFFVLFMAIMPVAAQQYKVQGTAPADAKVVYMYNAKARKNVPSDSVVLGSDRTFVFASDKADNKFGLLFTDREEFDNIPVVLEGDITVDFKTRSVTGTPENVALSNAFKSIFPYQVEQAAINLEAEALQKADKLNQETIIPLRERFEAASEGMAEKTREICEENQNMTFPALFLLDSYYMISHSDIIRWYDRGAAFMKEPLLAPVVKRINGWRRQEPGTMFADLEEADTLGVSHKLSEYVGKGNYVLIDFWASWCGPCMQEMPNVKAAYEKYRSKGFDVVGLSFDAEKSAWIKAIKENGMSWRHLSDLKYWDTIAAEIYGISSIPSTLLVGPDGKIVDNNLRGPALQKKLEEIYGF